MKKERNHYFEERFPERYKDNKILSHAILSKEEEKEFFADLRARVKEVRKELQMTQREFGETAGIDRRYVAKVECGSQNPSFKFMRLMSIRHKVSMDWLMFGVGDKYIQTDLGNYGQEMIDFKRLLDRNSQEDINVVMGMVRKILK